MTNKASPSLVRIVELSKDDVLNEFTIEVLLDEGLSKTAKIYDTKDDAAVKLFAVPKGKQGYDFRLEKFIGEAECLNKLKDSKHIVRPLTEYRSEGILNGDKVEAHYYAMEKMHTSLEKHMFNTADWPLRERLNVLEQVLNGLKDSHEANVFHRDLYTPNVLIKHEQNELVAKICDFGSAKQLTKKQVNPYFIPTGNIQYTSPEACLGMLGGDNKDRELFVAADIYSFGMLYYEVISGVGLEEINTALAYFTDLASKKGLFNPSYAQDDRMKVLENQAIPVLQTVPITSIIVDITTGNDELEDKINQLALKLLSPDYRRRPQSVDEVISELQQIKELAE